MGVHTPEVRREREVKNVKDQAKQNGLTFPVLIDNHQRNWNAWGNSIWPSIYLVDKQGYVRYWWYGELNWRGAQTEQLMRTRIEELLAED